MSRHRIGLSRMQRWGEPFIGEEARNLHRLAGDAFADFSSEYHATLHGFNRPCCFGFRVGTIGNRSGNRNEMYLGPLEHDPINPEEIEFYNGMTEEDFRVHVEPHLESGRSDNGFFTRYRSPLIDGSIITRHEPLSMPEFEFLVDRILSFYK